MTAKKHSTVRAANEIEGLVSQLASIQQQISALDSKEKTLYNEVVTFLNKRKADELLSTDGRCLLATYHAHFRSRFLAKEFEKAYPKLYSEFSCKKRVRSLLIK